MPTILKVGEEVLTENDPRHVGNGGRYGSAPAPRGNTKIINAIDGPSFLAEAMNTAVGEEIILNFIRANAHTVRGALG
ncbi:hypothetical protein G3A39_39370 [Paraburkholderia aspalathi]|nr:hypothetical protein [Paraburkholderia aspalathi]